MLQEILCLQRQRSLPTFLRPRMLLAAICPEKAQTDDTAESIHNL